MMGWGKVIATGLVLLFPQASLSDSLHVVINEVLYDPEGKDAGEEFIELHNKTGWDVCLFDYEVATGNGAYERRWTSEWRGGLSDTIRAGGFFVIGEEAVLPEPDLVTSLDLQNGPDACKLVSPQGDMDLVGWGDHDFGEYYETRPALDSGPGASLGRDPDGIDTDDNYADFAPFAVPSPGAFNRPPFDIGIEAACLSRYAQPDHATIQIVSRLVNLGTAAGGAGAIVHVGWFGQQDSSRLDVDIAPGEFDRIAVDTPNAGEGLHDLLVWLTWAPDKCHYNDTLRTSVLIWPSPVVVNELMFKPDVSECEWVELLNTGAEPVSLEGWTLEDSGHKRRRIAEAGLNLGPDGFLMLVEDEHDFMAVHTGLDCPIIRPSGGWPTLNDTDGRAGYADMVVIRDAFGTCVDSVAYRTAWGEPGTSVERVETRARSTRASNWSPHYGPGGSSPGRANSVSVILPEPGGYLKISPQTFTPDGDGRHDVLAVSVELPTPAIVRLKVFDINGRALRTLLDGDLVQERRITFWDGRLVDRGIAPIGVYVVLLEAKPLGGGRAIYSKLPVVLVRR
jgi:hypothetical protein